MFEYLDTIDSDSEFILESDTDNTSEEEEEKKNTFKGSPYKLQLYVGNGIYYLLLLKICTCILQPEMNLPL
jgi:hypothetical protein